ncbi:hypothetical protein [Clostridium fungisolvens]|uniref:Uncharacterized protein n=1 Tax=Clostridium fungisolvens TaxID=1604897 RepID=A0A6V8SMU2_9CLOT|nr:hypothetical protein [Clostridium fungisolvens]GFP76203.1 hypothetical protein bsdtw1_02302 [Clostridium fungisolvens]
MEDDPEDKTNTTKYRIWIVIYTGNCRLSNDSFGGYCYETKNRYSWF